MPLHTPCGAIIIIIIIIDVVLYITSASVFWVSTMCAKVREKAHNYVVGQPDGKTPLGRPKCTWKKDY